MAKKQFIRHLEYYGFPDQNRYSSDFSGADLSDIREKNKQQDKEIKCLEGEKADKKDLIALSGKVDTLIDVQSEFNNNVVEELSGITADIEQLKDIDNRYGEQLSALTDGVNDAICGIQVLGGKVDDLTEDLAELSGKVETFSAETQGEFGELWEELDKKLDKTEAEETYAKKEDVPTKDELDEILEDYATKEWVEEQGYLDQEEGDARYAHKEAVDALSDRVNSAVTDLNSKIYSVSGSLDSYKSTTDAKIGVLETNFATLDGRVTREINEISGEVATFDERIRRNTTDIADLTEVVNRKANKSDLDNLSGTVNTLASEIDTKVSHTEFDTYKSSVINQFNRLDDKKADKTQLTPIIESVNDVNDRLDQEIIDRTNGDTNLQTQINSIGDEINLLKEHDVHHNERLDDLEEGLADEIEARIEQKNELIGTSADTKDDNTIWGAKAFAKNEGKKATTRANQYTDDEIAIVENELEREHNWAEQNFSSAASKSYVDGKYNELKEDLETELSGAVETEMIRAKAEETDLLSRILQNRRDIEANKTEIDHNANSLHTITAWDAAAYDYDPQYYDDSGNGILDVLHREFHEFEKTAGSIKEIRVEGDSLIIVYYTKEGEKETVIPIGELIDLDNYYNKQETDALLDSKLDVSAYTDISEQVTENTANIEAISGSMGTIDGKIDAETERAVSAETELQNAISGASSALDALINKLGYTDNDTLVRNGDHEAAFGQYNISNTSEDASGRTLFSIGNGTDDENRSNALEVKENGDVYLWIEGEFMNINKLLGQIAHEVYDNDSTHNSHFFDGDGA